jgi:hypothetical protein
MFDANFGMFEYEEERKTFLFSKSSFENNLQFELFGTVLGLAIYNQVFSHENTLEMSGFVNLPQSFRVCFHIFPTRFECSFSGNFVSKPSPCRLQKVTIKRRRCFTEN